MPLIRVNATENGLALHDVDRPVGTYLKALQWAPGPTIIMLHGYKYAPGSKSHCPHAKIFGDGPGSWPKALGFTGTGSGEGLGIAFGWQARGSLPHMYRRASNVGTHVARLVRMVRRCRPGHPVHIIAHSLGAEAALQCLHHLPAHAVDRIVLLSGASYLSTLKSAQQSPCGATASFLNVTSRENDLFDAIFEQLVPRPVAADRALGAGHNGANTATLQIDSPQVLDHLGALGFHVASSTRRICHWSSYLRPGVMELYRQFLRAPQSVPLAVLQRIEAPEIPRWSRLITTQTDRPSGKVISLPYPARALRLLGRMHSAAAAGEKPNEHAY